MLSRFLSHGLKERLVERPAHRREYNIKIDLKALWMGTWGLGSSGSE
jgi:hypothetical protein